MSTTPTPDPTQPTYNQQLLAQIHALLLGKALDDVFLYKIGDRELTHMTLPELRHWEAEVEKRVRWELRRQKGLGMRFVPVMFGSAERIPSVHEMVAAGVCAVLLAVAAIVIAVLVAIHSPLVR